MFSSAAMTDLKYSTMYGEDIIINCNRSTFICIHIYFVNDKQDLLSAASSSVNFYLESVNFFLMKHVAPIREIYL